MALARNCLVHLIGLPGVGKLTIARELASALPAHLIDNHSINNLVFPLMHADKGQPISEEMWVEIRKIKAAVMAVITNLAPREDNYIFTNVLLENKENDLKAADRIRTAIEARDGRYVPVILTCAKDEHMNRYTQPQRQERLKPTDKAYYERLHPDGQQPLRQNLPYQFELDVTNLSPAQAAAAIKAHAERNCV